jgi:hypothetical protein
LRELPGWHDATEQLRARYRAHGGQARDRAATYGRRYQGRRAAMVFDVVLSRQRRYARVEQLAEQFAQTEQGRSLEALSRLGPGGGYPLRPGEAATMQAVAGGLMRYSRTHDLEEEAGVRQWAVAAGVFEFAPRLDPYVGAAPGIGPALFAYLRMRCGADALKPDRRVHDTLRDLGYPVLYDPHSMLLVAHGAAAELGVGLLVLDQLLWWAS